MEIWKEVKGYENYYHVSNLGNVKSLDRILQKFSYNKLTNVKVKGKLLKNMLYKGGYLCVDITNKSKKVHRLVAESFIDNPNNLPCVNHINGIKTDNRVENLEWCTIKENIRHAWETGLCKKRVGEKIGNSKLKEQDILFIRSSDKSYNELAKIYSVDKSLIPLVKKRKIWKHI